MKTTCILIFALIAIERAINTFKNREQEGKIHHKWSAPVLMSTYILVVLIALFDFVLYVQKINLPATIIGFLVMAVGIILRRRAIKTLGPNWSVHLKEINGQQLITVGPYRFFRHPYYVAVILELTGVSLYFNSQAALVFLFLVHLPLLLFRMKLEERILLRQFGDKYLNYRTRKPSN